MERMTNYPKAPPGGQIKEDPTLTVQSWHLRCQPAQLTRGSCSRPLRVPDPA